MLPSKFTLFRQNQLAWKLAGVNAIVIVVIIWLTGVSVKDFACYLVGRYPDLGSEKSGFFNHTMEMYLLKASLLAIIVAALTHFVFIRRILSPLKRLTESARQLTSGKYPDQIEPSSEDEIGQLTRHFNNMIQTLKRTEENRKRMMSNISHDLRTPLSNLNGYLEALTTGVMQGTPELYQSLLEESLYLTRLVEQLHVLTVWEAKQTMYLTIRGLDIHELLNGSIEAFQWECRNRNLELSVSLQADTVMADEDALKQVMNNLLSNAFQYNTGMDVRITGEVQGAFYRVTITNTGEPIPESKRELVFERFYRGDQSRHRGAGGEGSGLGLAIVKEIVELFGGKTGVSTEGDRHSFWFTVPRSTGS